MTETLAALREESEWTIGWRIVVGCALAAGAGIVLLFFTFNMFVQIGRASCRERV